MLKKLNSVQPLKRKRSLEIDLSTEEISDSDDIESSTRAGHQTVNQSFFSPKPTVNQEIIDMLPRTQKSEELYRSHWMYDVDIGGQAALFDSLSALLQYF